MKKLKAFQEKMKKSTENADDLKPALTEHYHGQILEDNEAAAEDEDLSSWHAGKLKFRKHIDDRYRIGSDGRMVDDYAVIDSRSTNK